MNHRLSNQRVIAGVQHDGKAMKEHCGFHHKPWLGPIVWNNRAGGVIRMKLMFMILAMGFVPYCSAGEGFFSENEIRLSTSSSLDPKPISINLMTYKDYGTLFDKNWGLVGGIEISRSAATYESVDIFGVPYVFDYDIESYSCFFNVGSFWDAYGAGRFGIRIVGGLKLGGYSSNVEVKLSDGDSLLSTSYTGTINEYYLESLFVFHVKDQVAITGNVTYRKVDTSLDASYFGFGLNLDSTSLEVGLGVKLGR